jgi:predicted alpha/beta hydrolase
VWSVERTGGERVACERHLPDDPGAVILCLPALGVPATYYSPLLTALAERGWVAVAADHRGNGTSSLRAGRGTDFGYRSLLDDTRSLVEALAEDHPGMPVFLLGHSLGGHVGGLVGGVDQTIAGLVLVASGTPWWESFGRDRVRVWLGGTLIPWVADLFGYYPGKWFGFGGSEARTLMHEWATVAKTGAFVVEGLEAEVTLARCAVPILAISFDRDWMAPAAAVDHLLAKLPQAPLERIHLRAGEVDPKTLHHFQWARHPKEVVDRIATWMARLGVK